LPGAGCAAGLAGLAAAGTGAGGAQPAAWPARRVRLPGTRTHCRPAPRLPQAGVAALIRPVPLLGLPPAGGPALAAQDAASEEQVKAVFLFNFAHFVDWPPAAFESSQPFVIGFVGGEEVVPLLEEAVRGEDRDGHSFQVRRAHST